jgi:hypothetical protein
MPRVQSTKLLMLTRNRLDKVLGTSLLIKGEDVMEAVDRPSMEEVLLPLSSLIWPGRGSGLCCRLLLLSKLQALSGSWPPEIEEDVPKLPCREAWRLWQALEVALQASLWSGVAGARGGLMPRALVGG